MLTQPTLLCFGRYQALLDTRTAILSKLYRVIPVATCEQIEHLPLSTILEMVLLCHTLRDSDCKEARALIARRWPAANILSMTKAYGSCALCGEIPVRGMDGPDVLLQRLSLMQPSNPA